MMEGEEGRKGHSPGYRQEQGEERKMSRRMGAKRWEAREEHMQEQGEVEGCEKEYALGGRKEGTFHGGG